MKLKNDIKYLSLLLLLLILFAAPLISLWSASGYDLLKDEDDEIENDEDEIENDEDEIENDEDEEDEDDEWKSEREIDVDVEDDRIKIEAELEEGDNKDEVELDIDTKEDEELEIELRYKSETGSTKSDVRFRVEFKEIIEYLDVNTTGNGYQDGEELSVYEIGESGWKPLGYTTETVDNVDIHVFTATTDDLVFKVVLRIAGAFLDLENFTLTPNAVKIDVEINNYAYTSNASSLALMTKVKAELEQEIEEESSEEEEGLTTNEQEISLDTSDFEGFFSWKETALADGQEIQVLNSQLADGSQDEDDLLEGESCMKIYFSFIAVTPVNIYWDPKVGVNVLTSGADVLSDVPGFEVWFTLLALLSLPLIGIRFRKGK